ncbi:MAG: metallopeptidase family protein [Planctomycetota bacterium]|nr:metallopeptidase family protein [Planctomycetota bacterium]MEC8252531.1 metallopeptidase family protein [Planctomycetota bacterium]MEC8653084.1 metallopeptidase family protein [Planctomycetota bacterium]MEC9047948.1 metallopeptidase family protein [Planctomycetota bacterium]
MDIEPEGVVPPDIDDGVGADPVMREIEQLLADGKLEDGLAAIDAASAAGRGIATDLTFLRGDAYLGLGMPREAEEQFRRVLTSDPDCPSSRCWLAMSLYLQWRFDEAEVAVQAARALPDALADADVVAGCLLERRGELEAAEGLFERAATAVPDKYVVPSRMPREEFDKQIQLAARALPRQFRTSLDRVAVIAHDFPELEQFDGAGLDEVSPDMLGLFDGVPLPESGDPEAVLRPNRIFLFQRNLERMSASREELQEQIRVTLYHELGHYLGFEEEDMDDLGLA